MIVTLSFRRRPRWLLVVVLAVFALAPLTYPGFFQVQSGFLAPFNAAHPAQAPAWGLPPDYATGLHSEGKLPYLLAWPFWKLSGSGVVAVKWGYGLAFLLGALGVYAWTRRWFGARGGVLAAVVYTYLPWHLSAVYVRGAYAEAWLWAWLPFVLWAVDRLAERRFLAALAVGVPALAAAAWSQPGLLSLALPLLVSCGMLTAFRRRGLALWLGAASVLLVLLLAMLGRTAGEVDASFVEHFLYPYQLLSASWGFGASVPGWQDGPSFQLGVAAVGLSLVALALLARDRQELGRDLKRPALFWAMALVLLLLLTLPPSALVWRIAALERFLIYPWQILALTGLPLAFLAGAVVRLDRRLAALPAWTGLLALVVLASYPYLSPRFTQVDPGPEPVALFQIEEAAAPAIVLLEGEIAAPPAGPANSDEITATVALTLTWQSVAPVGEDYSVFVHLLDAGGTKVAQRDTYPCGGECPTSTWQPGEIVLDAYQLDLPPAQEPTPPYRLAVGFYLLETGDRLPILGRDERTVYFDVP